MADLSDVEGVLVRLATAALYPDGIGAPSGLGADCRIYRGWPDPAGLDADLAVGLINVTVFPVPSGQRTTTRFPDSWMVPVLTAPSLTAEVDGERVLFAGSADPGQVAGVLVGGRSYVYRTQAGDTPALVAANLAQRVRRNAIVLLSEASFAVPGAGAVLARTVADSAALREVRRQVQDFRVSCWCSNPEQRDRAAAMLDTVLALNRFIDLPDGTRGRLEYRGSAVLDEAQHAALYRRDLIYAVEYATTLGESQPAMLFGISRANSASIIG